MFYICDDDKFTLCETHAKQNMRRKHVVENNKVSECIIKKDQARPRFANGASMSNGQRKRIRRQLVQRHKSHASFQRPTWQKCLRCLVHRNKLFSMERYKTQPKILQSSKIVVAETKQQPDVKDQADAKTQQKAEVKVRPDGELSQLVVTEMKSRGIIGVQVDMDKTLLSDHSNGYFRQSLLDSFKKKVTIAAKIFIQACLANGIQVSIGTQSDPFYCHGLECT
jgi:hypothetical protein